jgi:DinB family protein
MMNMQHEGIAQSRHGSHTTDLPKLIIRRQLARSGNTLMASIEPLNDDEFFAGGPSGISSAWTVGHLACVTDLFGAALDDGRLSLPTDAHVAFNDLGIGERKSATKADGVPRQQFPKARILSMMRLAQVRLLKVLDAFDVSCWNEPGPDRFADTLPTYGAVWEHLAVHTYWHLGELSSAVERFHGTLSMNCMMHYFAWGSNDTEAARRVASVVPNPPRSLPKHVEALRGRDVG